MPAFAITVYALRGQIKSYPEIAPRTGSSPVAEPTKAAPVKDPTGSSSAKEKE